MVGHNSPCRIVIDLRVIDLLVIDLRVPEIVEIV